MLLNAELEDLSRLLKLSAEVARRIADNRKSDRGEIYSLANQIAEVAQTLQHIAGDDTESSASSLTDEI